MRNRGGFNRRTGKTTPRNKAKTHWGAKQSAARSPKTGSSGKSTSGSKTSKKATP